MVPGVSPLATFGDPVGVRRRGRCRFGEALSGGIWRSSRGPGEVWRWYQGFHPWLYSVTPLGSDGGNGVAAARISHWMK